MPRQSIPAVFREQVQKLQSRPMVWGKRDRHWRPLTWAQMGQRAAHVAAGLCALGVAPGDRVGILAESGPEWVLADLAALSAAGVVVSVYETSPPDQAEYILRDSGARSVFVGSRYHLSTVLGVRHRLPALQHVICLDDRVELPVVPGVELLNLHDLERLGEMRGLVPEVDRRVAALGEDDLLTLIYTSGTTGIPKGVMITHGNVLANCAATLKAVPVRADDVVLSFLPMSHSLERMAGYYMASLFGGAPIYYAESMGRLIHNLGEVRPTLMIGVPRVFEKIHARFMARRDGASFARRRVIDWALLVGRRVSQLRQRGQEPSGLLLAQYKLANDQVFQGLRDRLGGRIRFFISGAAPLAAEVGEFFHAAGLLILEGYGLSETSPVVSVNRPHDFRFGTVGKPLDNVRIRIAEDGEILVRGPNIMRGYYNQPEETARAVDPEGWLHTGDIGELDDDGFLRITDRKKDLFKTSSGKYVAPQHLERLLNGRRYIDQACVVGDARPFSVALLVPAFDDLEQWARDTGLAFRNREDLVGRPEVKALVQAEVDRVNAEVARHEAIRDFCLLPRPFTEAEGLLTPSLKVRRKAVVAAFSAEIDALYHHAPDRRRRVAS